MMWFAPLLWASCSPVSPPCERTGNGVGECAPELALPAADGSMWSLATQENRVVLVQFSAAWCGTCQQQASLHEQMFAEFRDAGFLPVTVLKGDANFDAPTAEDAAAWSDHFAISHPVVFDESRTAWRAWKRDVGSLPQLFLVDGQGAIRWRTIGMYDEDAFRDAVERELKRLD